MPMVIIKLNINSWWSLQPLELAFDHSLVLQLTFYSNSHHKMLSMFQLSLVSSQIKIALLLIWKNWVQYEKHVFAEAI